MVFEERRWEREGLTDLVSCGRIAAMEPFVSPGAQQTGLCPPLKKADGGQTVEWKTFGRTNRIYRSRCLVSRSER